MRYLKAAGLDITDAFRDSKEVDKGPIFVQHDLECNDVVIAASLLERLQPTPEYYLVRFIHGRVLKRERGNSKVIPDALLEFRSHFMLPSGKHRSVTCLVEHDRGTEEQTHFKDRIRAYIALLKAEEYKERFQAGAVTVAFTTFVGLKRLEQMISWTRQELAQSGESPSIGLRFVFTSITRANLLKPDGPEYLWLEPCWLTAYGGNVITLLGGK